MQHHINSVDVEGNLGLNEDSILHYFVADQRREIGEERGEKEGQGRFSSR